MAPLSMAALYRFYMTRYSKAWALQRLHSASRTLASQTACTVEDALRCTGTLKAFSLIGPFSIPSFPCMLCAPSDMLASICKAETRLHILQSI